MKISIRLKGPLIIVILLVIGYLFSGISGGYEEGVRSSLSLVKWWLWVDAIISGIVFILPLFVILESVISNRNLTQSLIFSILWMLALFLTRIAGLVFAIEGQDSTNPTVFLIGLVMCEILTYILRKPYGRGVGSDG